MENTNSNGTYDSSEFEYDTQENDVPVEKYLTFYVDSQLYTIPSSQVIEIISMQDVTYMPKLPEYVKGVINIRSKVIPLIELQLRLKKTPAKYDEHTCIIVVEIGDISAGFIVDRVHDVSNIAEHQISPPPKISNNERQNAFLLGIAKLNDGIAMVLDSMKTMQDDEKKKEVVAL